MKARLSLLMLCVVTVAPTRAQQSADAVLTFHFERPGVAIPIYTFTVHEDGTGTYVSTAAVLANGASSYAMSGTTPAVQGDNSQPLALSAATSARLFERARSLDRFRVACASKAKGIADTGAKTLSYMGRDGTGSCTYNYTENKNVAALTDAFQGMAFALDEGARLQAKHRFDRLGLDAEMNVLVEAIHEGRALELSNIAPVLRSLAEDPQLLERVRTRAARLLEQSTAAR